LSDTTRSRIARGSKLYREHIGNPLVAVRDKLSGSIGPDDMQENMGSFWIGPLTIPAITSTFTGRNQNLVSSDDDIRNLYLIPFLVPPLRDGFETESGQPIYSEKTSPVTLDAISFGFDNRDEQAPIADHRSGVAIGSVNYEASGKLNYDTPDPHPYTISLFLFQKDQYYFQDSELKAATGVYPKDKAYAPGSEIWRYDFSGLEVLMEQGKPNPFTVNSIGLELDRYSTYTLGISCKLGVPHETLFKSFALVGATIGLRCLHPLLPIDKSSVTTFGPLGVQNQPTKPGTLLSISGSAAAPGAPISADDASNGISTFMGAIDAVADEGVRGGFTREGEPCFNRSLSNEACYEVIAVPLMQNRARGGIGSYTNGVVSDINYEPYINTSGITGESLGNILEDVRIIPIKAPLTIHNIFLAWSWDYFLQETDAASFKEVYGHVASSQNMKVTVGVGIGEGIGSDNVSYQQVALHTMSEPIASGGSGEPSAANWDKTLVDRISSIGAVNGPSRLTDNISLWGHEVHQIPLVKPTGVLPASYSVGTYYEQGEPFWVSRAWTGTGNWPGGSAARTDVNLASPTPGQASTGGRETFLEVRMQITDTAGKLIDYGATNREVVSGYGGHWLYIIGKKKLVGDY